MLAALTLNALGQPLAHVMFPQACADRPAHGALSHIDRLHSPVRLLAALAVLLLLRRHRWALPVSLAWSAWVVFVGGSFVYWSLDEEPAWDAISRMFALSHLVFGLGVSAVVLRLRRRGVLR